MTPAKRERPSADEVGYTDAMTELEEILDDLERDQLDVDVLAERVRRASELLTLCRDRISRAQADVDKIVADLDAFDGEEVDELDEDGGS